MLSPYLRVRAECAWRRAGPRTNRPRARAGRGDGADPGKTSQSQKEKKKTPKKKRSTRSRRRKKDHHDSDPSSSSSSSSSSDGSDGGGGGGGDSSPSDSDGPSRGRKYPKNKELRHIFYVLWSKSATSDPAPPIIEVLRLEDIQDPFALLSMDDTTISSLTYQVYDSRTDKYITTRVSSGDKTLIRLTQSFHRHYSAFMPGFKWTRISKELFDNFRMQGVPLQRPTNEWSPPTGDDDDVTRRTSDSGRSRTTLAQSFQKSIKRDPDTYPLLVQDYQWPDWSAKTRLIARSHDIMDVLDNDFDRTLLDSEHRELFEKEQAFFYVVLRNKVKTNMGIHIVKKHLKSGDAQAAYKDLCKYYQNSTFSVLRREEIYQWLSTIRLNDTNAADGYVDFITNLTDKMNEHDALVSDSEAHFILGEGQRFVLLKNALAGVTAFNDILFKDRTDQIKNGGSPMTYDQYYQLVLSYATHLDTTEAMATESTHYRHRARRTAYEHRQSPRDDSSSSSEDSDSDDDDPTFMANMNNFRPSMGRDQWNALAKADQEVYDKISDAGKAIILGYKKPDGSGAPPSKSSKSSNSSKSKTKVNQHQIEQQDQDDSDEQEDKASDGEADNASTAEDDKDDVADFLAMITKQRTGKFSKTSKSKSKSSKKTSKDGKSRSSKKDYVPPGRIDRLMGKRYTVSVHKITYKCSPTKLDIKNSKALIDRGANGGLVGSDVRILYSSDRAVDVSGIDEHQVTDLKIVTAGGVVKTNRGEVVAILNQQARLPGASRSIISCGQLEHFKNSVDD